MTRAASPTPRLTRRHGGRPLAAALTVAALALATACSPSAYGPVIPAPVPAEDRGPIADSQISVQLFNFFYYVGFGESEEEQARQDQVLARLADAGYTNVEVIDYTRFQGLSPEEFRALLDAHGLAASALHTSVTMSTSDEQWGEKLDTAETLGAPYVGAGSTPEDLTTAAEWEAYADLIDHLGAQAAQRGMRYVVHLHGTDFASVDDGASAFKILLDRTSPQNVVFELDLYWAVSAGEDPVALVTEHRDRIAMLHVKDMDDAGELTTAGEGTIDLAAVFAAAGDAIEYYVIERDPPLGDEDFDPFTPSYEGLRYLQRVHF